MLNTATVSANETPTNVSITDTTIVDPLTASLTGRVYFDANDNGSQDAGEQGIENVVITLSGTDNLGATVNQTDTTDANGDYAFNNLAAGTYQLSEAQPSTFDDGSEETNPSLASTVGDDIFQSIVVMPAATGTNFNFGETLAFTKRRFLASVVSP